MLAQGMDLIQAIGEAKRKASAALLGTYLERQRAARLTAQALNDLTVS